MPLRDLKRIWTILAAFLVGYALNSTSASQGGPAISGGIILESVPVFARFWGVHIIGVTLFVLGLTGLAYARGVRRGQSPTGSRMGLFPLYSIAHQPQRSASPFLRTYFVGTLALIYVAPLIPMMNFYQKFDEDGVIFSKQIAEDAWRGVISRAPICVEDAQEDKAWRLDTKSFDCKPGRERRICDEVSEERVWRCVEVYELTAKVRRDRRGPTVAALNSAQQQIKTTAQEAGAAAAMNTKRIDQGSVHRLFLAQGNLSVARWMIQHGWEAREVGDGTGISGPEWLPNITPWTLGVSIALGFLGSLVGLLGPLLRKPRPSQRQATGQPAQPGGQATDRAANSTP